MDRMAKWDDRMYKVLLLLAFASSISTAATSIGIGLGLLFVLVQSVSRRKLPQLDSGLGRVVLLFCLLQCLIAAASQHPGESFSEVWGMIYRFFPLFFAMLYVRSVKQLRWLFIAFTVSIFIDNIAAVIQMVRAPEIRPHGFNVTHTFYGDFLLMALPILLLSIYKDYMQHWAKWFAAGTMAFSLLMLVLTYTRGAWVALAAMLLAGVLLGAGFRKRALEFTGITVLVFALAMALLPDFQGRMESIADPHHDANTERVLMWKSALAIGRDHPVLGIGQDQFVRAYNTQYISPLARERSQDGNPLHGHGHPHNNLLKQVSEGGTVGVLAYLLLYGYVFWRLWNCYRAERGRMPLSYGLMGLLIFIGIQAAGLTDTNVTQVPVMREYWLLTGMLLVAGKVELSQAKD